MTAERRSLAPTISIKINIPTCKQYWIFCGPAAYFRGVIPVTKPYKAGVSVMQTTCKPEWNIK